jgi:hypothetical protein
VGDALKKIEAEIQPLDKVMLSVNPPMKRRAAEKKAVMDGSIPLVVDGDIVVALDAAFMDENREIVAALDASQAEQLLTYTAHRLGHVLGAGGKGPAATNFNEDTALLFLLILRMAGRLNDPFVPECRVIYDLTNPARPLSIEML